MQQQMPSTLPETGGTTLRIAGALIIVSFVLAALYLGRVILEPLAIAILLAFVLTPPLRRLRSWHIGRTTSVILVVAMALAVIVAAGFVIETQITQLASQIPTYQRNLSEKIASINETLVSSGTLKQASSTLSSLAAELRDHENNAPASLTASGAGRAPIPVEVRSPQPAGFQYLQDLIGPLITPLTMVGLLILFLIFILFYREDLRDRLLRLGGTQDLQRTTEAMNDAGRRLSRYFLVQAAINVSFGVVIGVGLWALGVPNFVLWGVMAAILRFVPYLGTPIAAVFPLVLAASIDPGWTKVLLTALLFFGSEILTGQAIEPVLQGQQTGLSPLAIVVAQLFWTLIWGVPGLLLAVPVTVCIAVLARHTESLNFLGVILGDQPALAPHEGFYQRLLAGDATEAAFQAEEQLANERLSDYYDAVPMKALALAHADGSAGKLSEERQRQLLKVIADVADDLSDYSDEEGAPGRLTQTGEPERDDQRAVAANGASAAKSSPPILLTAARSPIDEAANLLLSQILAKRGIRASIQPYNERPLDPGSVDARLICVSCFGTSRMAPAAVRYLIRRYRRLAPEAQFVACFWPSREDVTLPEEMQKQSGADLTAASLKEAVCICASLVESRATKGRGENEASADLHMNGTRALPKTP
jgi:predicted PurR-regulated permease PerM